MGDVNVFKKQRVFLYGTDPYSGCHYYRAEIFLRHARQFIVDSNIDFSTGKYHSIDYIIKKIRNADIVVFLRPQDVRLLALFQILKLSGKKIFIDNDDDFSSIHQDNPAYYIVGAGSQANDIFMELADGAIGSTDALAKKMRNLNSNVVQVSNYIDLSDFSVCKSTDLEDKYIRVGITGSAATLENTRGFVDVLKKIQDKNSKIRYVFFSDIKSLNRLREYFPERAEFIDQVVFQEYPQKLCSLNLDMALIPRSDNEFNRYKSNCKYLEYVALGIPVIAQGFDTHDGPYDESIINSTTGYLVYSENEWYDAVERLTNGRQRMDINKQALDLIKEKYDIKKNVDVWEKSLQVLYNQSVKRCRKEYCWELYKNAIHTHDEEIALMRSSKFWKMRNKYIVFVSGIEFVIKNPKKFFVKYWHKIFGKWHGYK